MHECMIATYIAQKIFVFASSTYAEPVACGFIPVLRTVKPQMCTTIMVQRSATLDYRLHMCSYIPILNIC